MSTKTLPYSFNQIVEAIGDTVTDDLSSYAKTTTVETFFFCFFRFGGY